MNASLWTPVVMDAQASLSTAVLIMNIYPFITKLLAVELNFLSSAASCKPSCVEQGLLLFICFESLYLLLVT